MTVAAAHRLSRDQLIWSFGPDLEPVLEIEPGETVTFETNDCFTGQIRSEDDDHLRGKGARIFFPVRQPGGMFAVGTCTPRWATAKSASPAWRSPESGGRPLRPAQA